MKTENKNGLLVFLLPELLTVLAGSTGVYGLPDNYRRKMHCGMR